MAQRYKVVRLWVKYKGRVYRAGELLPEEFNHHDRFRLIYPSRVGLVEVPDALLDTPMPPKAAEDTPTGDIEPPVEETITPDNAIESTPPTSDEVGSEDKTEEPTSEDEEAEKKNAEINEVKVTTEVSQPPKAKPVTAISNKAPTGSKPERPLSKSTGAPTRTRRS
jgi:hypothetical protein